MRYPLLCSAMLLVSAGAYALSPSEKDSAPTETAAEVESASGEKAGETSSAPAATFTPTEKIEADSAVSFPVDI